MATNAYSNSVPLGREGTGAATVLGPSRALQYIIGQDQNRQNRIVAGQERFLQNQQQYNNQFQKTLMELSELGASPMFAQDFNELTNEIVKQGAQLNAQGINPYNPVQTPQAQAAVRQWQGEVNKLRSAKQTVDLINKQKQDQIKQYLANPDSYDFDDYQKLKDFEKNYNLEDLLSGAVEYPQLGQRVNISDEITKQYGQVYRDFTEFTTDPNGNQIRREVRDADRSRIASIVNSEFTPNTKYGQEVNRLLRREFGEGATINGLIGTTDRDEIRSILDGEFRNPSDNNPIVELRSRGINARPGTPEYESFLERAVDEQLRAETILDNAKQQAANALIGKANTRSSERFDFSLNNEMRARNRENRSRQSFQSSEWLKSLRANKLISGGDTVGDSMIDEAIDLDFSEDYGDGDVEEGIKVFGAIPLNTASISINPADITDVNSGQKTKQGEIRGNISGVGIVAYDANGNVVKGNSPEALAKDPRVVSFKPQVVVQDNKRNSYSYDTGNVPVSSLSKASKANVEKAISIQKRTADQLNSKLKTRPAKVGANTQSWNNYNNSINNLFGTQGAGANQNRGSLDNL